MASSINHIRLKSIDVFRAITMVLMIWVNDFWTLHDIPSWLQHAAASDDALGFSDVIFPAFLFIVGLSIPLAIRKRWRRNEATSAIIYHILIRTFSLLAMGFLLVNFENFNDSFVHEKMLWQILLVPAFFLIWNHYSQNKKRIKQFNQFMGVGIIIYLALNYHGGSSDNQIGLQPHWWGILGLIGWAYLTVAAIYVIARGKIHWIVVAWLVLCCFHMGTQGDWLDFLAPIKSYIWFVGDGAFAILTLTGTLISQMYLTFSAQDKIKKFIPLAICLAVFLLVVGFMTRHLWGISKIRATPSWVGICAGISILAYIFLHWLVDLKQKSAWANFISPAGTSTLTCYLVPYIYYAMVLVLGISVPIWMSTGIMGLLKSFAISIILVFFTGSLNGLGIKLKL